MESLILSFNAILPIFILMILGYFLKKINITDKKGFDTVNKLVFKVFLPVLLFYNIYKSDAGNIFDVKLIMFSVAGVIMTFILGYFVAVASTKENSKRGVMLQGIFRSNVALLGLPLIGYIYGENAGGLISLVLSIIVPLFNILAIIALERFSGGKNKFNLLQILKGIIKNPLIVGCFTGIVFLFIGIKLPAILEKSVKDISSVATPLSIICLGAEFEYKAIKESIKEIIITVGAKLVIVPFIMLTAAVFLGFTGEALVCILITFGAPVAVSSFVMAKQMGGDENLAAHLVVVSSAFCLITLFLWIFTLSSMNLL